MKKFFAWVLGILMGIASASENQKTTQDESMITMYGWSHVRVRENQAASRVELPKNYLKKFEAAPVAAELPRGFLSDYFVPRADGWEFRVDVSNKPVVDILRTDPDVHVLAPMRYNVSFDWELTRDLAPGMLYHVTLMSTVAPTGDSGVAAYFPARREKNANSFGGVKGDKGRLNLSFATGEKTLMLIPEGRCVFAIMLYADHYSSVGDAGVIIRNLKIEVVPIPEESEQPDRPVLRSPEKAMTLSPNAEYFTWRAPGESTVFSELEFSSDRLFREVRRERVWNIIGGFGAFYPTEKLPAGQWFWRVRGINIDGQEGPWSETADFTVSDSIQRASLRRKFSVEKPFHLLFHGMFDTRIEYYIPLWRDVPKDLREDAAFLMCWSGVWGKNIKINDVKEFCRDAETRRRKGEDIPNLNFLVRLAHDGVGGGYSTVPLSDIEWMFQQHYPWFRGVTVVEQHTQYPMVRRYLADLIRLAGRYGETVSWIEFGPQLFINNHEYADLRNAMHEFADNVACGNKGNSGIGPMLQQSMQLGNYLNGEFGTMAVGAEAWYWTTGSFGPLGQRPRSWNIPVNELEAMRIFRSFPENFWIYQALTGMLQGASVYYWESGPGVKPYDFYLGDFWAPDGTPKPLFKRKVLPFMRMLKTEKMIPSREELRDRVKAVFKSPERWRADFRDQLAPFTKELLSTMGYHYEFEIVPVLGDYFYVPALLGDAIEDRLSPDVLRIAPGEYSEEALQKKMRSLYGKPNFRGSAFVGAINDRYVVLNSYENEDIPENFEIELSKNGFATQAAGNVDVHQYIVIKESAGRIFLHIGNDDHRFTTLTFRVSGKPQLSVKPSNALLAENYNDKTGLYSIRLTHYRMEAVNLILNSPEK